MKKIEYDESIRTLKNHATTVITDFLYPPDSKRRSPLTRCLLISLIEYVRLNREKEDHKFSTILDMLSNIVEDMDHGVSREEKLKGLKRYFKPEDGFDNLYKLAGVDPQKVNLPDWVWRAYELFYNYGKVESQKYAAICLMYDLIPFADMKFLELYSAIMHRQKLKSVVDHQEKNATYRGETSMILVNEVRNIADKLFAPSEISKKSLFIAAVLNVIAERGRNDCDLNLEFDVDEIKTYLMRVISENEWNCTVSMYDNKFDDRLTWYSQIVESSEALADVAMTVVERILVEEGTVEDLINC